MVLDCGGGTVDGVTYTVTNGYPLRLKREVGRPSGACSIHIFGSTKTDNSQATIVAPAI